MAARECVLRPRRMSVFALLVDFRNSGNREAMSASLTWACAADCGAGVGDHMDEQALTDSPVNGPAACHRHPDSRSLHAARRTKGDDHLHPRARMSLLPPSTNQLYAGPLASVWFLGLYGLLQLGTGCVHYLLPDGGAGLIAGLDLTTNKHVIVGVFAWMGALQIAYGLGIVAVAFWYRPLAPLFLGLGLVERILMSVAAWATKPGPTGHHPPEHYASLLLIPVLVVFLVMATTSRSGMAE